MSIVAKEDRLIRSMRGLFEDFKKSKASYYRMNGEFPPKVRRRFDSILRQANKINELNGETKVIPNEQGKNRKITKPFYEITDVIKLYQVVREHDSTISDEALDSMRDTLRNALSANGGEAVGYTGSGSLDALKQGANGHIFPECASSHPVPVYLYPAPPSVAVPEQREWNQVTGRDGFKYTEGWNACREAMLAAAPSPDHSGDANKMVADHIADAGKVVGDHYDLGVALSRHFDELRDSDTGHIAFDPCDSNDIDEVLAIINAHLSLAPAADGGEVVTDSEFSDEFSKWWEEHGQFVRAGGGNYERTFAFEAWRHLYPRIATPSEPENEEIKRALVWAMNNMNVHTKAHNFALFVIGRGGNGDFGDCIEFFRAYARLHTAGDDGKEETHG